MQYVQSVTLYLLQKKKVPWQKRKHEQQKYPNKSFYKTKKMET